MNLSRVFLVAVAVAAFASVTNAQIPVSERSALESLYTNCNGSKWDNNSGWLGTMGTECAWYGVTCIGGHVTSIDLTSNNLSGPVPSELASLTRLRDLRLQGNYLSGPIPRELMGLSYLERLHLYGNQLTGGIPEEIGNLKLLKELGLSSNNNLGGTIPSSIGNLSNLEMLLLHHCQLSGEIPVSIENLSSIESLNLAVNNLSGYIPAGIWNLVNLTSLILSDNQLQGQIPPSISNLVSLYHLHLDSNQLDGSIPAEIEGMASLRTLSVSDNMISGSITLEILALSNLNELNLSENFLSGEIPTEIWRLASLVELNLSSNQLSGPIPVGIGSLTSLRKLGLQSNKLSGEVPYSISLLPYFSSFQSPGLSWNALYTDHTGVWGFLNEHYGAHWSETQTTPPTTVAVTSAGGRTVWLSWDATTYTQDPGGYEVFCSPNGSDSWISAGWTWSKSETIYPVTGLTPGNTYRFAVRTFTDPHPQNSNRVDSELSPESIGTTTPSDCDVPVIDLAWGEPVLLSVQGIHDSYLWNTGETTQTIEIVPVSEQWYWVTVSGPGSCEETAARYVDTASRVFADGFELGITSGWSRVVP